MNNAAAPVSQGSDFSPQGSQQQREHSYNQLRPERISLTPASRSQHVLHRWSQPEQQMSTSDDGMPQMQGMRSSEVVRVHGSGGGRSQDGGGNVARSSSRVATSTGGQGKLKQHLSCAFVLLSYQARASELICRRLNVQQFRLHSLGISTLSATLSFYRRATPRIYQRLPLQRSSSFDQFSSAHRAKPERIPISSRG